MSRNQLIQEEIRRAGAWILWALWRNRNTFFFEGNHKLGPPFIKSIFKEVDHWFFINSIEKQENLIDLEKKKKIIFGWKPPPSSWINCDIGFAWDKIMNQSGASWILCNKEGNVLFNGRRSFINILGKQDAFL